MPHVRTVSQTINLESQVLFFLRHKNERKVLASPLPKVSGISNFCLFPFDYN
jgi:hypothetical protein